MIGRRKLKKQKERRKEIAHQRKILEKESKDNAKKASTTVIVVPIKSQMAPMATIPQMAPMAPTAPMTPIAPMVSMIPMAQNAPMAPMASVAPIGQPGPMFPISGQSNPHVYGVPSTQMSKVYAEPFY